MAYAPPRDPTNVLGRRIVAFIVDSVLHSAVVFALLAATKTSSLTGAPSNGCSELRDARGFHGTCVQLGSHVYTWTGGRFALGILLGVLVQVLNLVVLQGATGASIGKSMLGLRVVNAQGQVCGIGRAALRWLLLIVDSFCFALVGLITTIATHPHRRVGDMAAGTYVVSASDVGQPIGVAPPIPQYAYAPQSTGWVPPQAVQPQWGAPPQPQQPQWGAPPQPQQPQWGAPPQPQQPQTWGAPPPPPRTDDQPGWAAPQPAPQQPQTWRAPQPYTPPPPQRQPYVPPPPPQQPPPAPPSWDAPPPLPPVPPTDDATNDDEPPTQ